MKCEICRENEATVHFKQVVNGSVQEMFICKSCAENGGLAVQGAIPFTDFLFGVGETLPKKTRHAQQKFPACGMRSSDFHETSRLGCATCYDAFRDELMPMIQDMQSGPKHTGKVPVREKAHSELAAIEDALQKAIEEQNFEEAARLRDLVRDLRQTCGGESNDAS